LVDVESTSAPSPYVSALNFAYEKGTEAEREKVLAEGVAFLRSHGHWCCKHSRLFTSLLSHFALSNDAETVTLWDILSRQVLSCSDW
jgi:hypothetical protein